MLWASPQAGFTALLRCVTCLQYPIGPAQISGGSLRELRMTTETFPSRAKEIFGPQRPAETSSWPRQTGSMCPVGSTVATPESPSMNSAKAIFASGVQASQLAEAFIFGVTFVASPPPTEIV